MIKWFRNVLRRWLSDDAERIERSEIELVNALTGRTEVWVVTGVMGQYLRCRPKAGMSNERIVGFTEAVDRTVFVALWRRFMKGKQPTWADGTPVDPFMGLY